MPGIENFVNAFENLGKFLFFFFSDIKALYFATFLFFTILIYAILLAVIGNVPGFGEDKHANRFGKVVAFVIALISSLSIYMVGKERDMLDVINSVVPIYGVFGGAVLGILFFMIIVFGFRKKEEGSWQLALLGIGIIMAIVGYFLTAPSVQAFGWFGAIIGLILYISSTGLVGEAAKAAANEKKGK